MIPAQGAEISDEKKVTLAKYRSWKLAMAVIFCFAIAIQFLHDLRSNGYILKIEDFSALKNYTVLGVSLMGVASNAYLLWRSIFKSKDAIYIKDDFLIINYTYYNYSIPLRDIRAFRKVPFLNIVNVDRNSEKNGLIVCICLDVESKKLMKIMKEEIKASHLMDITLIY